MEKRLALILANLFLCVGIAFAQMQVTGTVVSQDDNEPVVGASIMVVGTNTGTVTDINGKFSLAVPAGRKNLRISYVGMEPVEVTASPNMRMRSKWIYARMPSSSPFMRSLSMRSETMSGLASSS